MDDLAKRVMDRLAFAAHVDGGAPGQALLDRLRLVSTEADSAVLEWLELEDGTGQGAEGEPGSEADLVARYRLSRERLTRMHETFETLIQDVGPELAMIEQALAAVPRRVHDARLAITGAQAAVEALRLGGLAPEGAEQALIRVRERAQVLDDGAAVHGIAEILAAADVVVTIAAEARRRAEQFPHQRDEVARRLVAGRTHLDVAEAKGPRLESALAALDRGYPEASWHDLGAAPELFQAALDDAADALEQAEASARRLAYPPALRLLEHARVALTRADQQVRLVTGRLAMLDTAQAPPPVITLEADDVGTRLRRQT
jgi:hypothetical protein